MELLGRELARLVIIHAQRAERMAVGSTQRCAGVEAYARRAGHHRVVGETFVEGGIRHDHHLVVKDRVVAKRVIARGFAGVQSADGLEPLTVLVHEGHRGNRRGQETGG